MLASRVTSGGRARFERGGSICWKIYCAYEVEYIHCNIYSEMFFSASTLQGFWSGLLLKVAWSGPPKVNGTGANVRFHRWLR